MRTHTLQDATGDIIRVAGIGVAYTIRGTTPTDGQPGFMIGCKWFNNKGTAGSIEYTNIGTASSSNWLNIC